MTALCRPTPRGDQPELLDDPDIDEGVRVRALHDVARANAWFGGRRAVLRELLPLMTACGRTHLTVLDVGVGAGDIAAAALVIAQRRGVRLTTIGVDNSPVIARLASHASVTGVCGDALSLPFAHDTFDIVVCSQLLHHFHGAEATRLLRELDRVARHYVIVAELRRSRLAALAFRAVTPFLRFHDVSRHDGLVSIRRGFTRREVERLVCEAIRRRVMVRRRLPFRLAVTWQATRVPTPRCKRTERRVGPS